MLSMLTMMNLAAHQGFASKKQRHAAVIGPSSMTPIDIKSSVASVIRADSGVDWGSVRDERMQPRGTARGT
jgi:hypothetical protein